MLFEFIMFKLYVFLISILPWIAEFFSFSIALCKIGIGICYDMRFPEMAQVYTQQGNSSPQVPLSCHIYKQVDLHLSGAIFPLKSDYSLSVCYLFYQPVVTVKQGKPRTLEIFQEFLLCYDQSQQWSGQANWPQNHKLINVLACSLFSHPWLAFFLQHNDIPDIFLVLTFSWFDWKKIKTGTGHIPERKPYNGKKHSSVV